MSWQTRWAHKSALLASLTRQDAWKHAIQKAKAMPDPWAEFHLEDIKTESCTRHRYRQPPRSLGVTPSVSPDTTPVWCLECHRRKNTHAVNLETSRAWTVDCGKQFVLTVYNPFHCLIGQMEPFFFVSRSRCANFNQHVTSPPITPPHFPTAAVVSPELYGMNVIALRFSLHWPRIENRSGMRREAALMLWPCSGFSYRLHPRPPRCSLIEHWGDPHPSQTKQTLWIRLSAAQTGCFFDL